MSKMGDNWNQDSLKITDLGLRSQSKKLVARTGPMTGK